jgi:cell division protein FtsQ
MGRKQGAGQVTARHNWRALLRYALYSAAVLALLAAALFLYSRVDEFLAADSRFRLAAPSSESGESPAVRIEGTTYTPRARIIDAFAADFGRSVYLLPLAERRRSLLAIDWVRDASVSRLWPDRLFVRIVERQPVAFVQLPAESGKPTSEIALIDDQGVILEQPPRAHFRLPVLSGIRRTQSEDARRQRVGTAMRLVGELGEQAGQLSEIDVGDADNVKVVLPAEGRALLLLLGNRNFRSRVQNFLSHFPEIRRRLPNASRFDLRLDDRITALGEERRGG